MSIGRDVRIRDLTMAPASVLGGLEPQLFAENRSDLLAEAYARATEYVPEWTDRGPDDAGTAILKVHATLIETAHRRLNRVPRRLALEHVGAAGVRALAGTAARAVGGIEIAEEVNAPTDVPGDTVFTTPAGPSGPVLEIAHGCTAVPGRVASAAVLADGWLVLDRIDPAYGVQPFGTRPHPPAEFWLGVDTAVTPAGTLTFAIELRPPPGRATAESVANQEIEPPPLLRWEAMTAAGAVELPVDADGTGGLRHAGVIAFRVPNLNWPSTLRPGQTSGTPLRWLRARLLTSTFPPQVRLRRITLNGVEALAARTIRDEIVEPIDRPAIGGARYRLAQVPVVPGSVILEIDESGAGLGTAAAGMVWTEMLNLVTARPDDRVFVLDPVTGLLSFGDGLTGRAVPEGYRNVLAREYRTAASTAGLPVPGALLSPELNLPDVVGLRVNTITSGSAGEATTALLRRGPEMIRSRGRGVAAADYASVALGTPGIDIARAHCLPGGDPGVGSAGPGTLGVVVVPRVTAADYSPRPDADFLQAVADHLAQEKGVAGARVVAMAPNYREVSVQALLVGKLGADLPRLVSAAREAIDNWLSPLGGGDGSGWAFGEAVRWNALVRMLLERVTRLEAVSQVSFTVDGRRRPGCADVALAPGELVWPGTHLLEAVPVGRGGAG
jgi:predicted phage baseplate assembly protein